MYLLFTFPAKGTQTVSLHTTFIVERHNHGIPNYVQVVFVYVDHAKSTFQLFKMWDLNIFSFGLASVVLLIVP